MTNEKETGEAARRPTEEAQLLQEHRLRLKEAGFSEEGYGIEQLTTLRAAH